MLDNAAAAWLRERIATLRKLAETE
jgi:hypothetical protein